MSLSKEARAAESGAVLESMLAVLGASAIDETLFDPQHPPFQGTHSTTWDELAGQGWIEELEGKYRLTGTGWLGALRLTKQLGDQRFLGGVGSALGAMKAHIKTSGRKNAALVPLKQIAEEAGLPEGFVYNLIESRLVEEHHGRTGAKWRDKGRMILIPRDFNIEPADLNDVIREEADFLIEELRERLDMVEQELSRYQCPHCKSGLGSVFSIELSEHDSGTYESFECGYAAIDGWQQQPCPNDPKFHTSTRKILYKLLKQKVWLPKNRVLQLFLSTFLNVSGVSGWIRTFSSTRRVAPAGKRRGGDADYTGKRGMREPQFESRVGSQHGPPGMLASNLRLYAHYRCKPGSQTDLRTYTFNAATFACGSATLAPVAYHDPSVRI